MSHSILADYVNAGWALVPIPQGQKGPIAQGWNLRERCITDPEVAEHLDGNVGLAHAYSGTCAIDCDDLIKAREWFAQRGVKLGDYLNAPDAVLVSSGRENRAKLLYRLPAPLPSFKLDGLELRCASRTGATVQDVLPPSIHPDTGQPYEWTYGDDLIGDWRALPELPEPIALLWQNLIKPDTKIVRTRTAPRTNLGKARELIGYHNPDGEYDNWLKVGMALHYETEGGLDGLDLWDEWSSSGSKYKGRADLELHWRSFHVDTDNPVTIASLRIDTVAEADEFDIITEEEVAAANLPALRKATTPAALKEALNLLQRDKTGRVFSELTNLIPVLSIPEFYGSHIALDTFKDALVIAPYGTSYWRTLRDTDYTAMRLWLEGPANFHPTTRDKVRDCVHYIAEDQKVDTAQNWLTSITWDGKPRIRDFFVLYMGTIATEYEYAVGEYLWTALAGRIMEPGCQVDMTPILVGPQGVGKTQGVKAIAPAPEHYAEIKLGGDEDAIARKLRGVLIAELAELKGLRTGELEAIKAFMTRTHEKWIPKYVEFATEFARRVVFIGTTNEHEFLNDSENRRWLPLTVSSVDVEAIKRDREQLWAEGLAVWMEKGIRWRGAASLAAAQHEGYKISDNWADIVEQWVKDHGSADSLKISDVLLQAIGLDARHVTRVHEQRAARILGDLGYKNTTVRVGLEKKVTRMWVKKLDKGDPTQ